MKFNGFYHLGIFVYLVNMLEYASLHLYKDAYKWNLIGRNGYRGKFMSITT